MFLFGDYFFLDLDWSKGIFFNQRKENKQLLPECRNNRTTFKKTNHQQHQLFLWIGCFPLLHSDSFSVYTHTWSAVDLSCHRTPSCNSKQKRKNSERRQQGRQKAVCCLAADTVDWRVGGADPSVRFLVCVLWLISSCSGCSSAALAVCKKVAGAHQGFAPSVSAWTCETAPGRLLHSCSALTGPKKKTKKQNIVRRLEEPLTARAAGQMICYIGCVCRRLCF